MQDRIEIVGLTTQAIIGVKDHERVKKQELVLDLSMDTDIEKAARSDDLSDTVDYEAVTNRLLDLIEKSSYELLEALIEDVARVVLLEFPVDRVQVRIQKPEALAACETVALTITRDRSSL